VGVRTIRTCVEVLPTGSARLHVFDQAAAAAAADAERSIPGATDRERIRAAVTSVLSKINLQRQPWSRVYLRLLLLWLAATERSPLLPREDGAILRAASPRRWSLGGWAPKPAYRERWRAHHPVEWLPLGHSVASRSTVGESTRRHRTLGPALWAARDLLTSTGTLLGLIQL